MNNKAFHNPHIFSKLTYKNAYDIAYAEQDMGNRTVSQSTPKRERYEWIMEEYFKQLDKHIRLAKPFKMPHQLGVIEMGSRAAKKGKMVPDRFKMASYFKKHGVRKLFMKPNKNLLTGRVADLIHHNWTPYVRYKRKGKITIAKRKIRDIDPEETSENRNPVKGYNQFLYKFLPNRGFVRKFLKDLEEEPTLIFDYRRL